jgi:tRNA(Met) cytidine acetyltransferase
VAPCLNTTWRRNTESHHAFDEISVRTKLPLTCEVKTTMSRRTITNHLNLHRIIGKTFTNTKSTINRTLIVIELAPQGWLKQFAQTQDILCIAADSHTDQSDRVSALLGSEHTILAHEVSDPMDASLLAALAGTVAHSGVLILAVPFACNGNGSSLISDDKNAQLHSTNQQHAPTSNFSRRFTKLLDAAEKKYPHNIILAKYRANGEIPEQTHLPLHPFHTTGKLHSPTHELTLAQDEQDSLLLKACAQLVENKSLCISIVGKRGRGKSALTARIANWLCDRNISYRITALHGSALSTFHSITDHSSTKNFIPVQELEKCEVDTLLVDEASNMPLALLEALMTRHNRLILCTTVEGYESSGRAFDLRMQYPIKQNFESQLLLSPMQPWRWLADDPIESLIDAIVLNGAKSISQPKDGSYDNVDKIFDENRVNIRKVAQQKLLNDEQELENIFGLLRDTHYQTTVKDLQHLLDGNDISLWVLEEKTSKNLLGVLLLTVEHGIEHSLHEAILRKQRRLRHHLLAQLLAQTANSTNHLTSGFARVVRISVAHSMRRKGIGSMLINHAEHELINKSTTCNGIAAVGASFANDSASMEFWRSNGYTTFHKGYRKNPRTGKHAVAVLKSHDTTIKKALNAAAQIVIDNQAWQLAKTISIDPERTHPKTHRQPSDQQLLEQFAMGYRSVHDTYAALSRLSISHPVSLEFGDGISRKHFEHLLREQVASILNA